MPQSLVMPAATASSTVARQAEEREVELHRRLLAKAFLAYALLWLLEGALRKWFLVGIGTLLYVAKDLFAIGVYLIARTLHPGARGRRLPPWIDGAILAFGLFAALQCLVLGGPVTVAIIGTLQFVGPLTVIAVVTRYLTFGDGIRTCKLILAFAPLQLLISVAQVFSSPQSWINQVGEEAYGAMVNGDTVRTSGTFTSAFGLFTYLILSLSIALAATTSPRFNVRPVIRQACLASVIGAICMSGSRGALLFSAVIFVVFSGARTRWSGRSGGTFKLAGLAVLVPLAVFQWAPTVAQSFTQRFIDAERSQTLGNRIYQQFFGYLPGLSDISPLGEGAGITSSAGIALGSGRPWIEHELLRWATELGFVGLVLVILRQAFALVSLMVLLGRARSADAGVPLILYVGLAMSMLAGQINSQPSGQGFTAIAGSLVYLSLLTETRARGHPDEMSRPVRNVSHDLEEGQHGDPRPLDRDNRRSQQPGGSGLPRDPAHERPTPRRSGPGSVPRRSMQG